MGTSIVNRSGVVAQPSQPSLNSSIVNRSIGSTVVSRPPMVNQSASGNISQAQMDEMLKSGTVKRGPNGVFQA